ncbi:hypothetical protein MKX03_009865 [Papaver bracteatum]|nr:hypothetical protein MKX03_009865 [Papaver bracteatum]
MASSPLLFQETLELPVLKTESKGTQVFVVSDQQQTLLKTPPSNFYVNWGKTLKPNMIEINSATELVESLLDAGDKLVILDFYSPGCGGCKALHPKICQIAENLNALIFKVNYEDLKPMCYSLNIHVLPFFRFCRGADSKTWSLTICYCCQGVPTLSDKAFYDQNISGLDIPTRSKFPLLVSMSA